MLSAVNGSHFPSSQAKPLGLKNASNVLTAIDVNFRAIHIGRCLGAQEINGLRHFFWPA
jgi:hypothetical protein